MACFCEGEHGFAEHKLSEETFRDIICGPYGITVQFLPPELRHIPPVLIARYVDLRSKGFIPPPK